MPVFLGIDVGTGGVRSMAVSECGAVVAEASRPLPSFRTAEGAHEQEPDDWWRGVCETVRATSSGGAAALCVTSTSGSLVVAGAEGRPLRRAMLYDDARAGAVRGFPDVNASYSLAKAVWVREHEPGIWAQARFLLHPADWLAGRLCAAWGISDNSNSLKLGYDPEQGAWSAAVRAAAIPPALLPRVLRPGQVVAGLAVTETGLPAGVPVVAGATDGMAGLIASGARSAEDANTTLGTTIVWKALSKTKPTPGGGIYCHLHPSGLWAPGAASNCGPGCLRSDPAMPAAELDRCAEPYLPARLPCYPLAAKGERFPFLKPDALGFWDGAPSSPEEAHAAQLQALAFVERWGYEVMEAHGVPTGNVIYSTGSAASSPVLARLRASILDRAIVRCCHPCAAFGAAVLAATAVYYGGDISAAIGAMTRQSSIEEPDRDRTAAFDDAYSAFREACARRGYGA